MQSQEIGKAEVKVHTPDLAKDKRKGKDLTVTLHIGGQQVETLTAEQRACMCERLSKIMSRYYAAHPEEYQKI